MRSTGTALQDKLANAFGLFCQRDIGCRVQPKQNDSRGNEIWAAALASTYGVTPFTVRNDQVVIV